MTCKDCIYNNICSEQKSRIEWGEWENEKVCKNFQDKTLYIKLPCKVGDTVYYITEWDKYAYQHDHVQKVKEVHIRKDKILFLLENDNSMNLKNYNKWWFTDETAWKKAREIYRKSFQEAERKIKEMKENDKI